LGNVIFLFSFAIIDLLIAVLRADWFLVIFFIGQFFICSFIFVCARIGGVTQAVLKLTKLITNAQQREAVIRVRNLSPYRRLYIVILFSQHRKTQQY
jgi:hypothetical protein